MPYSNRDPKRDPNIDNHPHTFKGILLVPLQYPLKEPYKDTLIVPFKGTHMISRDPRRWVQGAFCWHKALGEGLYYSSLFRIRLRSSVLPYLGEFMALESYFGLNSAGGTIKKLFVF